jgi:hypothetical protein
VQQLMEPTRPAPKSNGRGQAVSILFVEAEH